MAGGRLGDIFGHRNVLLFGMTLFNIATLVCALVNDKTGLVVGRAFQGKSPFFLFLFLVPPCAANWPRDRGYCGFYNSFSTITGCLVIRGFCSSGQSFWCLGRVRFKCSKHVGDPGLTTNETSFGPILGGVFTSLVSWEWVYPLF